MGIDGWRVLVYMMLAEEHVEEVYGSSLGLNDGHLGMKT